MAKSFVAFRAEMSDFRAEVYKRFDRNERAIAELRQETKQDIFEIRQEMKDGFVQVRQEMDRRFDKLSEEVGELTGLAGGFMRERVGDLVNIIHDQNDVFNRRLEKEFESVKRVDATT